MEHDHLGHSEKVVLFSRLGRSEWKFVSIYTFRMFRTSLRPFESLGRVSQELRVNPQILSFYPNENFQPKFPEILSK